MVKDSPSSEAYSSSSSSKHLDRLCKEQTGSKQPVHTSMPQQLMCQVLLLLNYFYGKRVPGYLTTVYSTAYEYFY